MTELRKKWREVVKVWLSDHAFTDDYGHDYANLEVPIGDRNPVEVLALTLQSLADEERQEAFEAGWRYAMGPQAHILSTAYADYLNSQEER